MRAALLSCGLLALIVAQAGVERGIGDQRREIPRFILLGDGWVCVDRNPRQVHRQDCWPRLRSSEGQAK